MTGDIPHGVADQSSCDQDAATWDTRIMDSGHWPMLERPRDVIELITDLVESLG